MQLWLDEKILRHRSCVYMKNLCRRFVSKVSFSKWAHHINKMFPLHCLCCVLAIHNFFSCVADPEDIDIFDVANRWLTHSFPLSHLQIPCAIKTSTDKDSQITQKATYLSVVPPGILSIHFLPTLPAFRRHPIVIIVHWRNRLSVAVSRALKQSIDILLCFHYLVVELININIHQLLWHSIKYPDMLLFLFAHCTEARKITVVTR